MRYRHPVEASAITGIRSVTQEPGSNQVSIKYDTVLTQEAQGSLNDQRIQQLLLFAARNNYNSGVRMDSVDVLTQAPNDSRVREALMYALQNDTQSRRAPEGAGWAEWLCAAGSAGAGWSVAGADQRHEFRRADAGPATGRTDEGRQQCAIGADQAGAERIRTFRSARKRAPCWRRCRRWIRDTSFESLSLVVRNRCMTGREFFRTTRRAATTTRTS